jgi:hypothetical protein
MGRLIELTRRVLLAQSALDGAMDPALGRAVSAALAGVAAGIETGAAGEPADLRTPLAAVPRRDGEFALYEALVERVEALLRT